jgi:hypothetical protein
MPTRAWLILSLSILCGFPCSAQRSSGFGSRGGFGGGPAMSHFGRSAPFASAGANRSFVRPPFSHRFRDSRSLPPTGFFGEREFSSRARTQIRRSPSVPRPPDRTSNSGFAQRSDQVSESSGALTHEGALPSLEREERFQPTTARSSLSVPRPPGSLTKNDSLGRRPSVRLQGMSRFVQRPRLSGSTNGKIRFTNLATSGIPGSRNFLPSRFLFQSSPLANRFFFRRPLFFSSFFFDPFFFDPFFPRPFLFSPFFFNPFFNPFFFNSFFFPQPLFFSPFFSGVFFFPQPFFLSVSFSNPFFFSQPLTFAPFFSSPFRLQRPFLSFSRRPFVFQRPFSF